jgi:hypothetical protein
MRDKKRQKINYRAPYIHPQLSEEPRNSEDLTAAHLGNRPGDILGARSPPKLKIKGLRIL